MIDAEVIVIGGGLAGLLAAARAADENLDVVVVDKGSGASYQSSGVIDVMGCPPGGNITLSPLEGVAQTVKCSPFHPYSIASSDGNVIDVIKNATGYLVDMVSSHGVKLEGSLERNIVLFNTIGSFKVTCFCQSTMSKGALDKLEGAKLLVAGFNGLSGFNAHFCSSGFKHFASKFNVKLRDAVGVSLSLPNLREINLTFIELARMMDKDEFREELARKLSSEVAASGASHVALPTLGLKRPHENMKTIEEETGAEVFELVSPPPSVPAQRLMKTLEDRVAEKGVKVLRGYKAVGFEKEGKLVRSIIIESGDKRFPARARVYILATGKFIGGGLVEEEDKVREAVFNLPLYDERGEPLRGRKIPRLLAKHPFPREGHPLMGCGVKVNAHMRPMAGSDVAYDNLFIAGSLISGYNYVREKSGMGVAAVTGYLAGKRAAMYVS